MQLDGLSNLHDVIKCVAQKSTKKRYAEFPLLLEKWRELMDLVNVLRFPYQATIKLQRRDLTLSDTYGIWLEIKLRLSKIDNNRSSPTGLAALLLTKFHGRFEAIFANPAMKAAIFLDPRYRMGIMCNQQHVRDAKEFIMEMHRRLQYLKDIQHGAQAIANENNAADTSDDFNIQAELEQLWTNQVTETDSTPNLQCLSDFQSKLDAFDPPHMTIKDSLFEYWYSKDSDLELRNVAMAIFSISPCETQCERDFSTLKQILSEHRGNLSTETLENILTINLNKDLYLEVIHKQVQNMRKNKSDSQ